MVNLVILDRDGVINEESAAFIKSPEEWLPIPRSLAAIAQLTAAGYKVAVATNQSGIGRRLLTLDTLRLIHAKMQKAVAAEQGSIDAVFFCPHREEDGCDCRKPKPGLLHNIADHFQLDFSTQKVAFMGDSLRDLEAALAAGCEPILLLSGNGQKTFARLPETLQSIAVYADLYEAVQALLQHRKICDLEKQGSQTL